MSRKQDKVFLLAEHQAFDTLSPAEQNLVLQNMSKEEFDELHQSIQTSRQFFEAQKTEVSSVVKAKLDQAFQMKYIMGETFWVQRAVPLWQAAAACFLVALLSWAFLDSGDTEKAIETVYVYQTDTIFQDAPIVNESPQKQEKDFVKDVPRNFSSITKRNQKSNTEVEAISVNFELEQMPKVNDSVVVFQGKMGQSVKDDTLLMSLGGMIF